MSTHTKTSLDVEIFLFLSSPWLNCSWIQLDSVHQCQLSMYIWYNSCSSFLHAQIRGCGNSDIIQHELLVLCETRRLLRFARQRCARTAKMANATCFIRRLNINVTLALLKDIYERRRSSSFRSFNGKITLNDVENSFNPLKDSGLG